MAKVTYKSAGVDLDLYRQAMARIPQLLRRTMTPRTIDLPNGFAGLFRLDFPWPLFARRYQDPVLVACTDGVGTKLKVASLAGVYNTVGIDLVAMSVNDALCCGAEPLFFLDYVAMPKDDPPLLEKLLEGIVEGCRQADCALLGGETAILPDLYQPGDFDLAGFCVGVVENRSVITGQAISPGDTVLGLASTGFHSNGYSLVRKVVFEVAGLKVEDSVPELGMTVGQALLTPTRIYVRPIRSVLRYYRVKMVVHGIAHITGGGIRENLSRIVPAGVRLVLDKSAWPVPPIFSWVQRLGDIDDEEMENVFNLGLGMILVVSSYYATSIRHQLEDQGVPCWEIGRAEAAEASGVVWAGRPS
ncbi:phosphoribosylformylglycinamidine cyclo-ligase [Thermogutta sp.]|jgi:phosphoribosylformylglycinamidine cyclo-ligase|uniref:phosphoribosylformylglycinamidine cyclo-ligase n=1 Tax=Thermogutta sp. TaxID=1962930 RepID=UPI0032200509